VKIRVTRPDGTVIEAEGTPAECREFCGDTSRPAYAPVYPVAPLTWPESPPQWEGPVWYRMDIPPFTTTTAIGKAINEAASAPGRFS
jgi:hypothetical protein